MYNKARTKLFGLDVLELLWLVEEVIGVSLRHKFAHIRLLNKIFVALFLCERDCILLGLEFQMGALHSVGGRLPTHQGIFPSVTLLQNVPVHPPAVLVPGSGLRRRLRGTIDPVQHTRSAGTLESFL